MKREDWHAVLASEPATFLQVRACVLECERLGLVDRAGRLAACAALLGLAELGSTCDLCMGDAGRLLRLLRGCRDRGELDALLPRPEPARARPARPALAARWAQVIEALQSIGGAARQ